MIQVAYLTNALPASGVGYRAAKIKNVLAKYPTQCALDEYLLDGHTQQLRHNGDIVLQQPRWPGWLGSKTVSWIRLGQRTRAHLRAQNRYSLWHATNQSLSFLLDNRMPSIVTVHDLIELLEPQSRPSGLAARYLYRGIRRARHVIAVSKYTAATVRKHVGISPQQLTVIPNGVDGDFHPIASFKQSVGYATLNRELKIQPTNKIVLYVGSDHPRKNVLTAVAAVAEARKKDPTIVFIKVGEPGLPQGRAVFLQAIDHHNLREHVRLLGNVSVALLNELYNLADVLVFPSQFEGFGLPPLQAMAAGTPVITSNSTSLPEVVGSAGIMHDPMDRAGFAASIDAVLHDAPLAASMREEGLVRAQTFSWKSAAARELEVYQQVVQN